MTEAAPSDDTIALTIVRLLGGRPAGSSICPSEVARSLVRDEERWRALMPRVRTVAIGLRGDARVRITRGGEDVEPGSEHRGAIRLARGPRFYDPSLK